MADGNPDEPGNDLYVQTLLLSEVIRRILKVRGDIDLTDKPVLEKKPITAFRKRMRVTGLDKFNERTYISTVNFYTSEENLKQEKPAGAVIVYIPETYIVRLLQDLSYPIVDEDDVEAIEDAVGTVCNLVAGKFNAALTQLGYEELVMSHFSSYQNDVLNGVPYDPDQTELYEISFLIRNEVRMIVDFTMGEIPKIEKDPFELESK